MDTDLAIKMRKGKSKKLEGYSRHHLFTKEDVRKAVIKVVGEPKTDIEEILLKNLIERLHISIPKLYIPKDVHKDVHKIVKTGG